MLRFIIIIIIIIIVIIIIIIIIIIILKLFSVLYLCRLFMCFPNPQN